MFKTSKTSGTARPKGGYGASGKPAKGMRERVESKMKPEGKYGSYGMEGRARPSGAYGSYGKPMDKPNKPAVTTGQVGKDGMSWPKATIPSDQKRGRFNLPRGKFTNAL